MKLWEKKHTPLNPEVERFTVGDDTLLDRRLIAYDCVASKAHAAMLHRIGVLDANELRALEKGLAEITAMAWKGDFHIQPDQEDCHTAIETYLTEHCGQAGQKIHAGRSRNDQVLTAMRLYERDALYAIGKLVFSYIDVLRTIAQKQGQIQMPGYTHTRKAMPTTVGIWAECYADAAQDNLRSLETALEVIDQSPLGTAAGFGVPELAVDRQMTARALGFSRVMANPMYAQLSRGKFEGLIAGICVQILFDLNRMASDLILWSSDEFGFVHLGPGMCTGSSIMPQKQNPDVLELLRAKYHVVLGEEMKLKSLIGNLISGYHRDLQLTKGAIFTCIDTTQACLGIACTVLAGLEFDRAACRAALNDEIYATEKANARVKQGVPFRIAYAAVANDLKK
ncbi:MAG: argininosuccinate lyase [Myxococcota bacterium]|nr:argininosuccinate lyase [Myxococcota bacterium]